MMGKGNKLPMKEYWRGQIAEAIKAERQACVQVVQDLMERTSYSDGHQACLEIRKQLQARNGQG
jgi:hypothetical protein